MSPTRISRRAEQGSRAWLWLLNKCYFPAQHTHALAVHGTRSGKKHTTMTKLLQARPRGEQDTERGRMRDGEGSYGRTGWVMRSYGAALVLCHLHKKPRQALPSPVIGSLARLSPIIQRYQTTCSKEIRKKPEDEVQEEKKIISGQRLAYPPDLSVMLCNARGRSRFTAKHHSPRRQCFYDGESSSGLVVDHTKSVSRIQTHSFPGPIYPSPLKHLAL